jgi:uncharacterized protein YkwD
MKIRILVSFLTILTIYSCTKEELPAAVATEKTPATPSVVNNINTSVMLGLINAARQAGCNCGTTVMPPVPVLTWNEKLSKAAYLHSKDMADNNYFNHNNLQGLTPGQRITAAGYNWSTYGENIANGYASEQSVMAARILRKSDLAVKKITGRRISGSRSNYQKLVSTSAASKAAHLAYSLPDG